MTDATWRERIAAKRRGHAGGSESLMIDTADRNALIAEAMPEYRRTLTSMARSMCPNSHADVDDLIQEGYIAMWRAAEARAENLAAYLTTAARHRMLDVVRGRAQLGTKGAAATSFKPRGEETRRRIREFQREWRAEHDGQEPTKAAIARGIGLDPSTVHEQMKRMGVMQAVDAPPVATSLDALVDDHYWSALLEAPDVLDGVALAYHHGEIAEALDDLPAHWRQYVIDRFWHGMSDAESNARRETSVRWYRVRPVLAERLAHLADA
jgi:RNA polymerase sigma factor (sigma-70 family)